MKFVFGLLLSLLVVGLVASIPILPSAAGDAPAATASTSNADLDVDQPRFSTSRINSELHTMDNLIVQEPEQADTVSSTEDEEEQTFPAATLNAEDVPSSSESAEENDNDDEDDEDADDNEQEENDSLRFQEAPSPPPSKTPEKTPQKVSNSSSSNSTSSNSTSSNSKVTPAPSSVSHETPTPSNGQKTVLDSSLCWKWETPQSSSKLVDGRGDHFSWTDKDGKHLYVLGGCGTGSHIDKCAENLAVQDLKTKMWDLKPIHVANAAWLTVNGAASAFNPGTQQVFQFGGKRDSGDSSGQKTTNWLSLFEFSKATGQWTWTKIDTTGVVPPAVTDATLSAQGNSVFLFGGMGGDLYFNKIYHTYTSGDNKNKWSIATVNGVAPKARVGHTATVVGDNKIYFWGGSDGKNAFDDLHELTLPANRDTDVYQWKTIKTYNTSAALKARAYHTTVLLPGNKLWIYGGIDPISKTVFADSAILDLSTGYWMSLPASMARGAASVAAQKASATIADQGRAIYVTGGCGATCQNIFAPRVFDTNAICKTSCVNGTYAVAKGVSTCKCEANFQGKFCEVAQKCSKKCLNGGSCLGGTCRCSLGFGGEQCEKAVCPNNCTNANRGTCSDAEARCVCKPGFWGLDCSHNACPNNCYGRGICQAKTGVCECRPGFSGPGCEYWGLKVNASANASSSHSNTTSKVTRSPVVYKAAYTCPNHCSGQGICAQVDGKAQGVCKCQPGFGGPDCSGECTLHCSGDFAGTCAGGDGATVKCKCNEGFRGPGCMQHYCANNCSKHGQCVNGACLCSAPWSGAGCQIDTTCSSHGNYENGICNCKPGFGGRNCEQTVKCTAACQNNGTCVGATLQKGETVAHGICKCASGWGGENCAKKECPSKCSGNGVCQDTGTCKCYSGFMGSGCEKTLSCPNNCTAHGLCGPHPDFPGTNKGQCTCNPGWAGSDCNDLGCPNNCYGRGKCIQGKCDCADGFSGKDCGIECPNKCSGNGLCLKGACKCHPGHSGADCSAKAACPKTAKGECSGNGVCFQATGKCFCTPGFDGAACDKPHTCGTGCGEHGRCSNSRCYCDPGYQGKFCTEKAKCPSDCSGHGLCLHGKCFCNTGFTGVACNEFSKDTSCPNNCHGRGLCQYGRCFCANGHAGADCGEVTSKAVCLKHKQSTHVCEGRGSCTFGKCFCNPGFAGKFCEHEELCSGGCVKGQGVCMLGKCRCLPGFKGPDCSEDLVCEGSPTPCSGHGICIQGTCACESGYVGAGCDKLAAGHKPCPNKCSENGVCLLGKCFCVEGRTGADCSITTQNACPGGCNNNGACRFGQCFCKPGFAGRGCEKEIKCSTKCLTNGVCAYGKCFCVPGYQGKDCDVAISAAARKKLLEADVAASIIRSRELAVNKKDTSYCAGGCNSRGICVDNKCYCQDGFAGANCRHFTGGPLTERCGNNCTGHGECLFGKCVCQPGYVGEHCQTYEPIPCPKACSSRGQCSNGRCLCEPGFQGLDCATESKCDPGCAANGKGVCLRGTCRCVQGFKGPTCNTSTSVVAPRFTEETTATTRFQDMLGLSECPGGCGGNGLCVEKQCYCKPGFSGADCSSQSKTSTDGAYRFQQEELPEELKVATSIDMHQGASHMSYALLSTLSFTAGVVVCVLAQAGWEKHKDNQRKHRQKKLIQPLLHSIDH